MEFRTLRADEIDVKVGNVNSKGYTLLLYKNARVDMAILDETLGVENWQRDHKECKGNLYCGIGIWCENKKQWIWKWDCGTESAFGDKEKGEASDSFKRAGFNVGIGRELYTAPRIFIPCETHKENNVYKITNDDDRYKSASMKVSEIEYNDKREICYLEIQDNYNNVCFKFGMNTQTNGKSYILAGDYKFTSGKYKGKTIKEVEEVDSSYLDYLLESDKVSQSIKDNILAYRS